MSSESRIHIPYVHNERGKEFMQPFEEVRNNYELEFEGNSIEFAVYDFRKDGTESSSPNKRERSGQENENPPVTLYFMGVPQIETVKPNDLTAGILERAQERNQVVIIPRFKQMPTTLNIEDDVVIASLSQSEVLDSQLNVRVKNLRGKLAENFANEGIHIDFAHNDLEIITYSSGSNVGLQSAELIDSIPRQQRPDGSFPKRTLISLSSSSAIDEIPFDKVPTGKDHVEGFNKQVTWAVVEETRLRLNSIIDAEHAKFNEAAQKWISENGLEERAENYARLQKMLLDRKDKDGNYEYPYLKNNMKHIPQAPEAFDQKTMLATGAEFLKLSSFPQGIKVLIKHIKESTTDNLGMLFDVLRRISTGSGKYTYEQLLEMPEVKLALIGLKEAKNINDQFIPTEHRIDSICDGLSSFDVKAVWPVEDLIANDEAYGATLRRLLTREDAPISVQNIKQELPEDVGIEFEQASHTADDKSLGILFTKYSKYMGKILFPNANAVDIRFEGERGHMSGSHLAPMKNSAPYFK